MKKLLCILLSAIILFGLTISASAATVTSGIRGVNEADFAKLIAQNNITLNDRTTLSFSDLMDLEPNPGDVVKIPLTANLFIDKDKKLKGVASDSVSLSALNAGEIAVRTTTVSGAGVAAITLDGNKSNSYIKIEFSKSPEFTGKKFTYSVFLSYRGQRQSVTRIGVKGTLSPKEVEIKSSDFYADLSEGATAKAAANVRNIEFYLGEYCSVVRTVVKGKTYQGIATTDILSKDEVLFSKYPELAYIYRLKTAGLKTEGNPVSFDLEEKFYVYNTNGEYIGTTDKSLPYWTKYYLSAKKYTKIEVIK